MMRYKAIKIMKAFISIYIVLFSIISHAHAKEIQLNTEIELHDWCKDKAEKYFRAKEKTLHNWLASWRVEKNIIDIKATAEADNVNYVTKCRVKKGSTSKLAVISIAESKKPEIKVKTETEVKIEAEIDIRTEAESVEP